MPIQIRLFLRAEAGLVDIERALKGVRLIRITYTAAHARVVFQARGRST